MHRKRHGPEGRERRDLAGRDSEDQAIGRPGDQSNDGFRLVHARNRGSAGASMLSR
jgi:hypothetical protein